MPIYSSISKPVTPKYIDVNNSLTTGLVFDGQCYEGSTTSTLDLAGSVTGTLTSGPVWGSGTFGYEITYDGSNDLIAFTSVASQNGLSSITIEALVNRSGNSTNRVDGRIMDKRGASFRFCLGVNEAVGDELKLQFQSGWTSNGDWSSAAITNGAYYHVAATYSFSSTSNVPIFYINGSSVSITTSTTPTGSALTDGTNLTLGNRPAADRQWNGKIVYACLWNRILSAGEILSLYQNPWRIYTSYGRTGDGISSSQEWRI